MKLLLATLLSLSIGFAWANCDDNQVYAVDHSDISIDLNHIPSSMIQNDGNYRNTLFQCLLNGVIESDREILNDLSSFFREMVPNSDPDRIGLDLGIIPYSSETLDDDHFRNFKITCAGEHAKNLYRCAWKNRGQQSLINKGIEEIINQNIKGYNADAVEIPLARIGYFPEDYESEDSGQAIILSFGSFSGCIKRTNLPSSEEGDPNEYFCYFHPQVTFDFNEAFLENFPLMKTEELQSIKNIMRERLVN